MNNPYGYRDFLVHAAGRYPGGQKSERLLRIKDTLKKIDAYGK
jgi:hypothetical protein